MVRGLLAAWVVTFAASFLLPSFIAPTGDGFFGGFNRIAWWFWLQVAAGVIGIAAAVLVGRDRQISPRVRLASHVVLAVTLVLAVLVAFLVMGAAY